MRALVYEDPKVMNVRQVPIPVPGDKELLIRVSRVGICGSELSGYLGYNSLRKPPLIMGHEFAGTVAGLGKHADMFRIGDRVTANPLLSCGRCDPCTGGSAQLCVERKLVGAHVPGAFAEYVVVSEANVYPIPDSVSFEVAAYTEPFACAVHICRLAELSANDQVLIIGAGPIGLCVLAAAKAMGLRDVVVMDLNPDRLQIVRELGGYAVSSEREVVTVRPKLGFDAAVDAVGAQTTRIRCVESVRRGGRVVFSGLHEADASLPVNTIIREELKLFGAFAYSQEDFATAISRIADGTFNLLPWTLLHPLEQGTACFEKLISGPGSIAKILLVV
ncbi:alcohol dehydrogenase catalytic domain-containing protein [Paenibacillus sp. IB182363]|uniref:Alcohol dehydrogenase catalytic domain-containing protein n=2 Tax=Paenibacillus oceani TaxID=2772510 RepID=A0A927C9G2_9BACL|nr:alcohol dehydrogenase catalytic domain-containing protein [Paenibacillus oceani]